METLNSFIWSYVFMPCFLCCGLLLTVRCGALQFRGLPLALRCALSGTRQTGSVRGGTSSFQASCTALAATIGTGNIIGTAQAIAMGGCGAVFWLWCAALLGMIIKYAEIYLGVKYRRRGPEGFTGGPMHYIELGLGRRFKPLAGLYAALCAVSAICMGNMAQVNGAVSAAADAAGALFPLSPLGLLCLRLGLGALISLALLRALSGGVASIGRAAQFLVPVMGIGFLLVTTLVLICHAQALPTVLSGILRDAFTPRAGVGAAGGIALRETVRWGARRSAFSNEAGLGFSAIAHAASSDASPAREGLWGIFEVFADTIVICTATALAILSSGIPIPYGTLPGSELLLHAVSTVLGPRLSSAFVAVSLGLFGFSSALGSAVYGMSCFQYLFSGGAICYRLLYCGCAMLSSVMSTSVIWLMSDTVNALMALPNFIALFALSHLVGTGSDGLLASIARKK